MLPEVLKRAGEARLRSADVPVDLPEVLEAFHDPPKVLKARLRRIFFRKPGTSGDFDSELWVAAKCSQGNRQRQHLIMDIVAAQTGMQYASLAIDPQDQGGCPLKIAKTCLPVPQVLRRDRSAVQIPSDDAKNTAGPVDH